MLTNLYAQAYCTTCMSSNSKDKRIQKLKRTKPNPVEKLSYSKKPRPTPLLINPKPYPKTKLQALEAVIDDVESSLDKGIRVDVEVFTSLLETCYRMQSLQHGVRVHRLIPQNIVRRNAGLSFKLVHLYASFGFMDEAHELFDQMSRRDISAFPWNSLISGYAEAGQYEDAMALFFQMREDGVEPDVYTFPRVIKACGGIGSIQVGEEVHRHVIRSGFFSDVFVLNALVDMYAKCGDIVRARKIFDMITCRDCVSWNSMLTAYIHHGLVAEAIVVFHNMIHEGHEPDSVALSKFITGVSSMNYGTQIHGWVVRRGFEWNLSIVNSLIILYSNHGMLEQARWLFHNMPIRDIVSWNSTISAHSKNRKALLYFEQMEKDGILPDNVTFVSILSTCAHLGLVEDGERLFSVMTEKYGIRPIMEHYGCMVNLYGRAGLIQKAYGIVTEKMKLEAGPTVWGALLYACSLHCNVTIGEIAAAKLFDLEPDNEHNFQLLMKIYSDSRRLEDVERVRKMLVDRGLDY